MALCVWMASTLAGEDLTPVPFPKPSTDGGRPLMAALKDRRSTRDISDRTVPMATLGNLLWAGFGINRSTNAHRTAPSAMNSQELEIYVALAAGVYRYDAKDHALQPVATEDIRRRTGGQDYVKVAPIALIFVGDLARLEKAKPEDRERYGWFSAGCVSQNVSLFCASEGLATVVHETDRKSLAEALHLKPDQRVILSQSVGWPK